MLLKRKRYFHLWYQDSNPKRLCEEIKNVRKGGLTSSLSLRMILRRSLSKSPSSLSFAITSSLLTVTVARFLFSVPLFSIAVNSYTEFATVVYSSRHSSCPAYVELSPSCIPMLSPFLFVSFFVQFFFYNIRNGFSCNIFIALIYFKREKIIKRKD